MSLSKQLYIIIAFIFFIIFSGNFFISVNNMKEYLEVESTTKAQDTATSIGMSLRPLINDKTDPEITSIIRAIANSGFYKEIRLENNDFIISQSEIIGANKELDDSAWSLEDVKISPRYGSLEKVESDNDISEQLLKLENEESDLGFVEEVKDDKYRFLPNVAFKNGGQIVIDYTAVKDDIRKTTSSKLDVEKVLVSESRDVKFDYVPSWFISMIPINLEEKYSEISDGWNTSAKIYVSPNPGEAYAKLFEQAKNSIIYATIAFIVSMIILLVFVQFLLRPLKKIEKLAKSIAQAKFGTIDELPWTTEIKNVAIAMNDMSRKIEAMINKLTRNLENLERKLSQDELTELSLKQTLETDMKQMFIEKAKGYVFTIKIDDLASFAKKHTNQETNGFIKEFAAILKNLSIDKEFEAKAYRIFGSEFVLIVKSCDEDIAKIICNRLKFSFEELSNKYSLDELAHIGATPFNILGTIPEMLQSANEAYEKAKLIGPNEFFIRNANDQSRDMDDWRDLVFEIIEHANFNVKYINDAYRFEDMENIIVQEAFTEAKDKDNNPIPIGTFISIAEKYEKIVDFDKAVIKKVIDYIILNGINHEICINLSLESISNNEFIIWLQKEISKNKKIASQLVFSITAYSVTKNISTFKNFCDYMHSCGSKIIVKRFETRFIATENLSDFNLDYIRLARDYTYEVAVDKSKKEFIESINELCHLLNIKVLAENVQSDKDYEVVKNTNIFGASR